MGTVRASVVAVLRVKISALGFQELFCSDIALFSGVRGLLLMEQLPKCLKGLKSPLGGANASFYGCPVNYYEAGCLFWRRLLRLGAEGHNDQLLLIRPELTRRVRSKYAS